MDKFDPIEALQDPEFHKLPIDQKLTLLRSDPEFAQLPQDMQGKLLAKADAKFRPINAPADTSQPQGRGVLYNAGKFVGTLADDVKQMLPHKDDNGEWTVGGALKPFVHPLDFLDEQKAAHQQIFQQADEMAKQGSTVGAVAKRVAGSIPLLGPIINSAGESIGSGEYGEGAARALEAGLMGKGLGKTATSAMQNRGVNVPTYEVPTPKIVQKVGAGLKGAKERAKQAAMDPKDNAGGLLGGTFPQEAAGATGYVAGHAVGGWPGAILGYKMGKHAPRIADAAVQGFKEGARKFDAQALKDEIANRRTGLRSEREAQVRATMENAPPPVEQPPVELPTSLPSGRVPGSYEQANSTELAGIARNAAEQLAMKRQQAANATEMGQGYEPPQPSTEPIGIRSELPSGRYPGSMEAAEMLEAEKVQKLPREEPAWKSIPEQTPNTTTPFTPVPSELPSGRRPGGFDKVSGLESSGGPRKVTREAPAWKNIETTTVTPEVPPETPTVVSLPSGRKVGGIQNQVEGPITPPKPVDRTVRKAPLQAAEPIKVGPPREDPPIPPPVSKGPDAPPPETLKSPVEEPIVETPPVEKPVVETPQPPVENPSLNSPVSKRAVQWAKSQQVVKPVETPVEAPVETPVETPKTAAFVPRKTVTRTPKAKPSAPAPVPKVEVAPEVKPLTTPSTPASGNKLATAVKSYADKGLSYFDASDFTLKEWRDFAKKHGLEAPKTTSEAEAFADALHTHEVRAGKAANFDKTKLIDTNPVQESVTKPATEPVAAPIKREVKRAVKTATEAKKAPQGDPDVIAAVERISPKKDSGPPTELEEQLAASLASIKRPGGGAVKGSGTPEVDPLVKKVTERNAEALKSAEAKSVKTRDQFRAEGHAKKIEAMASALESHGFNADKYIEHMGSEQGIRTVRDIAKKEGIKVVETPEGVMEIIDRLKKGRPQ